MSKANYLSILVCALLLLMSLFIGGGIALYYNLVAILVVFPGVFGATCMSYPFARIKNAVAVAYNAYTTQLKPPHEIICALFDISIRSRFEEAASLEAYGKSTNDAFLQQAVELVINGYEEEEIRNILVTEMHFFTLRRQQTERLFRHMANLSPAFGIAGSVIGLISMLAGMHEIGRIMEHIPIALTSTLYGIFLSYLFFVPIAENISDRTQRELLLQKVIIDGIIAINTENSSYTLETKLKLLFTPADRPAIQRSFDEMRRNSLRQQLRLQVFQTDDTGISRMTA